MSYAISPKMICPTLPEIDNPDIKNPQKYFEYLQKYNLELQQLVTNFFHTIGVTDKTDDIVLLATGSDGRFEKGPDSKLEVIVLAKSISAVNDLITTIEQEIRSCTESQHGVFFKGFEKKDINKERLSEYLETGQKWPSRILDASVLAGNNQILDEARRKMLGELVGSDGKSVLKQVKSYFTEYYKILPSGKQISKGEELRHYDPEKGESYYSKNGAQYLSSFKYGPNRTIQLMVIRDFIKLLRSICTKHGQLITSGPEYETASLLIQNLPRSVSQKLLFLLDEKRGDNFKLSYSETEELIKLYEYFIWQMHRSQYNYEQFGIAVTQFNPQEVQENIVAIKRLIDKQSN